MSKPVETIAQLEDAMNNLRKEITKLLAKFHDDTGQHCTITHQKEYRIVSGNDPVGFEGVLHHDEFNVNVEVSIVR